MTETRESATPYGFDLADTRDHRLSNPDEPAVIAQAQAFWAAATLPSGLGHPVGAGAGGAGVAFRPGSCAAAGPTDGASDNALIER